MLKVYVTLIFILLIKFSTNKKVIFPRLLKSVVLTSSVQIYEYKSNKIKLLGNLKKKRVKTHGSHFELFYQRFKI